MRATSSKPIRNPFWLKSNHFFLCAAIFQKEDMFRKKDYIFTKRDKCSIALMFSYKNYNLKLLVQALKLTMCLP